MSIQILDEQISSEKISKLLSEKQKIDLWLQQHGFEYNPFAFTDSERDRRLSEYFIEHPDFEKTIGLNHRLIFARPGDGKTAIRLRLQTLYRDALTDRHVFAFSYLISQEIADAPPQTIRGHINELLTAAVRHAFVFLALRGVELALLQHQSWTQSLASQFAAFFDEYYGVTNSWQEDLRQAILGYSLEQALENLAPIYDDLEPFESIGTVNTQWLQRWLELLTNGKKDDIKPLPIDSFEQWFHFCDLMKKIGIQNILVLVDSVDIKPTAQHLPQHPVSQLASNRSHMKRMVAIVTPLLQAMKDQVWGDNIYWKLFLPLELYLPLTSLLAIQVQYDIVEWDSKRLLQFLESRLSSASNRAVTSFNQLVERGDLELYLCAVSESSPRYLMYYVNKLFAFHVNNLDNEQVSNKISADTLARFPYITHRQTAHILPP